MKCHFLVFLSLVTAYNISANEDFSSLLDEMTDIATKTKLNIDYQPSVVSVVRADKLKKLGISNLHEALGILPGIETSILQVGWKQVIIRGNYSPDTFVFDKYKLYVDGVDVGSDLYSTSYYYLDFPIELIDRIEVLRGSASTIYGPGAFSGAINVITVNSENISNGKNENKSTFFVSTGSYEYGKGGFVTNFNAGNWSVGIDGYYQLNNKTLYAGPEFVFNPPSYKRTDYDSLENFDDYSFGVIAQNDNFKLITRYKSETTDNFYGLDERLEPEIGGYQKNKSLVFELQNIVDITHDISLETKLGLNQYEFTFDSIIYGDILQLNPTYRQLNSYIDLNLKGGNFENNDWMIGVNLKKIDTKINELESIYPSITADKFLNDDHDQIIKSIYFQDIYSVNENFDLSVNFRFDDYSAFDEMLSYRLGSVYRLDDNNIFKAIHGRSYRAPSYI
jgi:iron complex outermembrane receptor protein